MWKLYTSIQIKTKLGSKIVKNLIQEFKNEDILLIIRNEMHLLFKLFAWNLEIQKTRFYKNYVT